MKKVWKDKTWVYMGNLGRIHGLKGEVSVHLKGPGDAFQEKTPLIVVIDSNWQQAIHLNLEKCRHQGKKLLVKFEGIDDRTQLESQIPANGAIYMDRENFPRPEGEEFYWVDIIDATVVLEDESVYGKVTGLEDHGAGMLVEITQNSGESELYPWRKEFFPNYDMENNTVTFVIPKEY